MQNSRLIKELNMKLKAKRKLKVHIDIALNDAGKYNQNILGVIAGLQANQDKYSAKDIDDKGPEFRAKSIAFNRNGKQEYINLVKLVQHPYHNQELPSLPYASKLSKAWASYAGLHEQTHGKYPKQSSPDMATEPLSFPINYMQAYCYCINYIQRRITRYTKLFDASNNLIENYQKLKNHVQGDISRLENSLANSKQRNEGFSSSKKEKYHR